MNLTSREKRPLTRTTRKIEANYLVELGIGDSYTVPVLANNIIAACKAAREKVGKVNYDGPFQVYSINFEPLKYIQSLKEIDK